MTANPKLNAALQFQATKEYPEGLMIGLDVGSTTVKAVVVDPVTEKVVWKEYQRHETKQPEKCLELLENIGQSFPELANNNFRVFATGSGGTNIARHIGAQFVQEVNAVSLAVERRHPEAGSVIELGGQDAKIIIFKEDPATGRKRKIPSMNDKCAGGTGAVIDKISSKLGLPGSELGSMGYNGIRIHPVAGKCGVFAETDINGLQKQGVPARELMASLFESIVAQNLSVLTRGHTLRPQVLLLGGPNCYVQGLGDCWRTHIPRIWEERNFPLPEGVDPASLIQAPPEAQYFAAFGAVCFGIDEVSSQPDTAIYQGREGLRWYIEEGRVEEKRNAGTHGLVESAEERSDFEAAYTPKPWTPKKFESGQTVRAFVGVDGGSTSTKAVLVDEEKNVVAKAYELSQGNPIEDCKQMFANLEAQLQEQGCTLEVLGVGTTGYAKDILKNIISADVALVETVAHTQSGLHFYPDADVICDVGGQDIKVIMLKNGNVKDFKLNTQCSAGNGYFLQSTAQDFGIPVTGYADAAFSAEAMPEFGYGCAVFMQSDIVDFQRQGWRHNEIMAGLAAVLPKNIWLYVSQIPNLVRLGSTFVLQGGTQHNLAAVKSQVDFITSRFGEGDPVPRVIVHQHCGESGAIGAAFEAHRRYVELGHKTTFIGLDSVRAIGFRTTRDENTRCYFCANHCLRTFIDVTTGKMRQETVEPGTPDFESKVPLEKNEERLIIATCEKGEVEDVDAMRAIKKGLDDNSKRYPDLVDKWSKKAFKPVEATVVSDPAPAAAWWRRAATKEAARVRAARIAARDKFRIGMPKVLNMYSVAPFFMGYFQSLGIKPQNLVWSDFTSDALYKEGAKRGSVDPCFPSKVCIPHVHNLLYKKNKPEKPLDAIFFPMVDSLPTFLYEVQDSRACPTVTISPEATHAAFTKESDLFAEQGIVYKKTFVNMENQALIARQLFEDWEELLGLSEEESRRAAAVGWKALEDFNDARQAEGRALLEELERENRIGIVLLARPYHSDPGLNHEICAEFQKMGYPVFSQESLPRDRDIAERVFAEDLASGRIRDPFDIDDVWKNSYSENTSRKIWAAKFVARHPNLVALELSNFKCGHDAPIYTVVEEIIERSGTPFFYFKDIDENKPTGAIRIRVETISYFLQRRTEQLAAEDKLRLSIERRVDDYEKRLRSSDTQAIGVA